MPSGTPVTIAMPTATPTIERCSRVRSPIGGRLCRMNASVSTASPSPADCTKALRHAAGSAALGRARQCFKCAAVGQSRTPHRPVSALHAHATRDAESCDSYVPPASNGIDMPVSAPKRLSLLQRLDQGPVICAEGYVFELERRGYLQAGAFVPEVLFDHPEVVEQLHMDFVHAGSDVTQALTYYVHREKLRVIGREKDLVPMNRAALRIAKSVARRTGTLFAGDICNTNIYDPADKASVREVERIYHEQVGWAVEAGVDYFVAETI